MKKKSLIVIVASLILAGGILVGFLNSNYYYSKKLIAAIKEENIIAVQQIVDKKPTCVNAPQSMIPSGLYTLITERRMNYPLFEACSVGNIEIINMLIKSGANVNLNNGFTPLSIVYKSKIDNWYVISQTLIENGASLDYTTEYSGGKSSVLQDIVQVRSGAALSGYKPESKKEVLKAFNYALENCDHSNVNWMRVLQHSVSNDRIEIVKLLLDQEYCDVNDTSVGMTALMFAARDSTPEMVQLLLDYGADKSIKDSNQKTAYDYAAQSNNADIIAILENEE